MKDEKKDSTLGAIPSGKRDAKLESKPAPVSHKKSARPKIEPLQLPKGALIAFRKSGGLKFSSREIIIYPDGRVSLSGTDLPKQAGAAQKLNDAQIVELRRLLEQVGFSRLRLAGGQQPPDSYAYEIVAQVDGKSNSVEVFDGKIPEALTPLIQRLTKLLP
ncbi:MAG: hypothetical protein L0Y55_21725 [Anaerolineales bacterium]|nr:hypothetical protein [Anaerolineales bacterium]